MEIGRSYPSRRNTSAAANPAAPPPIMTTDSGQRLRSRPRRRLWRGFELLPHEQHVSLLFDTPSLNRIQRRCADRLASAKAETGVMPWTADRVPCQQTFCERPVIVRAVRADGEQLGAVSCYQHLFIADSSRHDRAIADLVGRNALCEILCTGSLVSHLGPLCERANLRFLRA